MEAFYRGEIIFSELTLKSIFLQRLKKAGPLAQLVRASDS